MTKLSLVFDQEIKCWIVESSSILWTILVAIGGQAREDQEKLLLVQFVDERRLHDFGLLGCGCSPNGWVRRVDRIASFRAIGIHGYPVAIGATVNSHSTCSSRRRRGDFHCPSRVMGGR